MQKKKHLKKVLTTTALGAIGGVLIDSKVALAAEPITDTVSETEVASERAYSTNELGNVILVEEGDTLNTSEANESREDKTELDRDGRQSDSEKVNLKESDQEIEGLPIGTVENTIGILVKVTYTDIENGKVVYSENHSTYGTSTTDVAETLLTIRAEDIKDYQLAPHQEQTIQQVVKSGQKNIVNFNIVARKPVQPSATTQDETAYKEITKRSVRDVATDTSDLNHVLRNASDENTNPYLTIERYWGNERQNRNVNYTVVKNGETVELSYKMGLTRIGSDEVELTEDAKKLGLTYDPVANYITGSVTLDGTIELGKYVIGLVSKADPGVKATADFIINSPKGFVLRPMYGVDWSDTASQYDFLRGLNGGKHEDNVRFNTRYPVGVGTQYWNSINYGVISGAVSDNSYGEKRHNNNQSLPEYSEVQVVDGVANPANRVTYALKMTTTPFGYFLPGNKTVADAKKDTVQYFAEIPIVSLDSIRDLNNKQVKIVSFEQIEGQDNGVTVELIDIREKTGKEMGFKGEADNTEKGAGYAWTPHKDDRKYNDAEHREFISSDPNKKVVNMYLREGGASTGLAYSPYLLRFTHLPSTAGRYTAKVKLLDSVGIEKIFNLDITTEERSQDGSLTNADVKFDAEKQFLDKGNVYVPVDSAEQVLGTVTKNKENATLKAVLFPDGTELNAQGQVVKKAGVELAPGKYTFEVKAIDGHFGDNAPVRVFTFEVVDNINPIAHQVWTEGQAIPAIPVSMQKGTAISEISIIPEDNAEFAYFTVDNENSSITGYAIKRTDTHKKARVDVKYINNDGTSTIVSTTFTYEVQPLEDNDLELSVTNATQTVEEGQDWEPMVISHTDGAILRVDTSKLPLGTRYNERTKTIAGYGLYEGVYTVPITVEKEGKTKVAIVSLTVTPGNFVVEHIRETIPVDSAYTYKINVPNNVSIDTIFDLPNGLSYDANTKTISGIPTSVGNFNGYANYVRTKADGTTNMTEGNVYITVTPKDIDVTTEDRELFVLDEMAPLTLKASDGAEIRVDTGRLPEGIKYDEQTKTFSGTPTRLGEYEIQVSAFYPHLENHPTVNKTVSIHVKERPIDVTVEDRTVVITDEMTPIVLSASDKAQITLPNAHYQLPPGVSYDPTTRRISGSPTKLGTYYIDVEAKYPVDFHQTAQKTLIITVTPKIADLVVDDRTVQVLDEMPPLTLTASDGALITVESGNLPNGVSYNADTKTISGAPTQVGEFYIRASANYPNLQDNPATTKTFKITVTPKPIDVTIENRIVKVLDEMNPITLTASEGASLNVVGLPTGTTYHADTKTISGTPTVVGVYDVSVEASYPNAQNNPVVRKTLTITVTPLEVNVVANPERQNIVLGNALTNVVVTPSQHAEVILNTPYGELSEARIHDYVQTQYGISYDKQTKTFSGIPNKVGTFELRVKVKNPDELGGASAATSFGFTVIDDVLDLAVTNANQTILLGKDVRHMVISHTDGATLTFDETTLPEGLSYDATSKTISGTPTKSGRYDLAVNATSLNGSKTKSVVITLDVIELPKPEATKEQSADPRVNPIIEGGATVSGTGVAGANISVVLPDGTVVQETVNSDGTWTVENAIPFIKGQTVTVKQTEGDKTASDAINITVVPQITQGDTGATGEKGDKGDKGDTGATGEKGDKGDKGDTGATGEKGDKGDKGDTGATGDKGDTGATGEKGDKGDKGDTGATGEKGDKGDKGDTGATGEKGDKGDKGDTGATGEKGDKGDKGETGATGEKGDKGDKGDTGATGEKGDKGDKGDTGATGEKGDKGDKGDTGATGDKGDKGDKGDTGATGEKGDKGDKGDTGATGEKGDKGDKGDTGATGEKGDKGDKGDTGATGEKGDKGDKGDTGATGEKGDKGDKGDTGATGEKGDKGDKGDTGATGEKGDKGDKGDTGATGEKGDKGDKGDPGRDGIDGKTPTVETQIGKGDNGLGVQVDGTWIIVKDGNGVEINRTFVPHGQNGVDGKDGKTPSVETQRGQDENGQSGVWVITKDGNGQEISRAFVKDGINGKDGKAPIVDVEVGLKDKNTGIWIIIKDSDGIEVSRHFIKDGKDGKTPTVKTESGKNQSGQSGVWIIVKDGDGNEISREFVKDGICGCHKPIESTDPTKPTNPTELTKPIKPINPNDSTYPTKPSEDLPFLSIYEPEETKQNELNQTESPKQLPYTGTAVSGFLEISAWLGLTTGSTLLYVSNRRRKDAK
ncbi:MULTISPECIES: putative Ig domain-containing protein [unclassified Granulicatella]|uniref:putative Ig domain-containing protein n=1 Tax=unclassified Granulicatella TaxID=2630493 RepID=UPI001ADDB5AF|nr:MULTISPECIES: putative Ig domain-containing protein [unclassified Granulicatella]